MGNKCDLEKYKVISKELGDSVASKHNMKYMETSAMTGQGIQEAFESLAKEIIEDIKLQKKNKEETKSGTDDGKSKPQSGS